MIKRKKDIRDLASRHEKGGKMLVRTLVAFMNNYFSHHLSLSLCLSLPRFLCFQKNLFNLLCFFHVIKETKFPILFIFQFFLNFIILFAVHEFKIYLVEKKFQSQVNPDLCKTGGKTIQMQIIDEPSIATQLI